MPADLAQRAALLRDALDLPADERAALRNLRGMSPGDRLVIYETGDVKSAVGTASVIAVQGSDAQEPKVKIKAAKPLSEAVPLSQIKQSKLFADSPLVRQGRLSVVPLTAEQYRYLIGE